MKHNYPRIKCPFCGNLAYISQLRRDYPIELKIQVWKGGRIGKDAVKFYPVYDVDRLREIEEFLKQRLLFLVKKFGLDIAIKTQYLYSTATKYPTATKMPIERREMPLKVSYA